MVGTIEATTLTAEDKTLLKLDPSGEPWDEEVANAMDEDVDEGEVRD